MGIEAMLAETRMTSWYAVGDVLRINNYRVDGQIDHHIGIVI